MRRAKTVGYVALTNKVRSHLRAVLSWAWEQEVIESLPRFPKPRPQRDVAGRHHLTKAEINALYFATHQMKRPRGWNHPFPIGRYWRSALVLFFNYGMDTGTIWRTEQFHEPTSGGTYRGTANLPSVKSKSTRDGGGYTIVV